MSVLDGKRLAPEIFKLDVERMRRGWYSDKYFDNIVAVLSELAGQGYRFGGSNPDLSDIGVDLSQIDVGNIEVEMQWFTRRAPYSVVVGVDKALAMLKTCSGYFDAQGEFVNTYDQLEVTAVQDGTIVQYDGDPGHVFPVIKVRGRYRDFAILETPTLGALTRGSRIATNVHNVMQAANGKQVLFFPARFDAHEVQAADGYAYHIAVQLSNQKRGNDLSSSVSTDAQGDWWGGAGGGTIAHAAIACFLGDTTETVMAFAATRPASIPRIALVDFNNDCVGASLAVMQRMFAKYKQLMDTGEVEQAKRYILAGVRPDTGGNMRDASVEPLGDKKLDMGVNPRLVFAMRKAIDNAWQDWELEADWRTPAQQWCHNVKIVVTGGFTPEKIRQFEALAVPADIYGVGSSLLNNCDDNNTNNDYTSDIVRVKIADHWYDLAKLGRRACDNPALEQISW